MSSARWQHIQHLYHAALERTPEQRAGFIAQACSSDSGLRREVESLLAYHGRGDALFARKQRGEGFARTGREGPLAGHNQLPEARQSLMGHAHVRVAHQVEQRVALAPVEIDVGPLARRVAEVQQEGRDRVGDGRL